MQNYTTLPGNGNSNPFDRLKAYIDTLFARMMSLIGLVRSGASAPTITDIAPGKYAIWYNTTTASYGIFGNNNGAIVSISTGGGGGAVTSVFTRTGDVVAATNDYTFAQIGTKPTTIVGYGITDAATLTGTQTLTNKTLTSPTVAALANLTTNGFIKTSGGTGTLAVSVVSPTALTDGTTITWNVTTSSNATITIGATGRTLTITNPVAGEYYTVKVVQDATGSRTITTWPTGIKWAGGAAPTLSTAANAIDIISFYYDGTNYFGTYQLGFA